MPINESYRYKQNIDARLTETRFRTCIFGSTRSVCKLSSVLWDAVMDSSADLSVNQSFQSVSQILTPDYTHLRRTGAKVRDLSMEWHEIWQVLGMLRAERHRNL